jgi:hypothetical protein
MLCEIQSGLVMLCLASCCMRLDSDIIRLLYMI